MYTSLPSSLVARAGLSVQDTLPYVLTGLLHVLPWSMDFTKTVLNPFRNAAYTTPVSGTTSICGSYCHDPLQVHSGLALLQVLPPSVDRSSAMKSEGQWPWQIFGSPIRVTR